MTHIADRGAWLLLAGLLGVAAGLCTPVRAAEPKAYLIQEIQITDPEKFKDYAARAPATVSAFGGVFIIRSNTPDVVSGAPPAGRVVVIEFPSLAKAKAWHESADYQKILPIRNASSTSRAYLVEGVAP
jgi:uncharacterized protein (DUF1330 family)